MNPTASLFLNIDRYTEKYPSLSSYNYCAGNPINSIDVNGDTINIESKKMILRYQDGTLYNQDGNIYNGKITKFQLKTKEALNKIKNTETGSEMIDALQKSKFNISIKSGNINQYKADNQAKASLSVQLNGTNIELLAKAGSGGTVYFNCNTTLGVLTTTGNRMTESFISLGHELAHAWDAINGTLNTKNIPGYSFTFAENFSTHIENKLRAENGLPLRTFYGYNSDTERGFYPLLKSDNCTSLYYNINYSTLRPQ